MAYCKIVWIEFMLIESFLIFAWLHSRPFEMRQNHPDTIFLQARQSGNGQVSTWAGSWRTAKTGFHHRNTTQRSAQPAETQYLLFQVQQYWVQNILSPDRSVSGLSWVRTILYPDYPVSGLYCVKIILCLDYLKSRLSWLQTIMSPDHPDVY